MVQKKDLSNNLIMQGSILAVASLIVRLIGLFYRIPLVNVLGDEGSGYYSAAFDIYSFMLIVSSYGFPAAISKVVASRIVKRKFKEAHRIFQSAMVFAFLIGVIFSLGLYFGSHFFANFINQPKAYLAIQGLAPALFIFSFMSVFRGYYQGMNTMVPTAISQVIEQVFNAVFSIVLSMLLIKKGVEYGAAGSSLGTAMGALAAAFFLVFLYFVYRPSLMKKVNKDHSLLESNHMVHFWGLLLMTSLPMVIGTSAFHLTNVVDLVMFSKALHFHGYSDSQIGILNGLLGGKYKLLITLPVSLASAMATASIPSITKSLTLGDHKLIIKKVDLSIRSVLLISIPSMVGLFILARPILELLFTNLEFIEITTAILQIGTVSIVFFGLSTISIGLLQGLNLLNLPVKHAIVSMCIKVLFNLVFLYAFNGNLYGAVITNIIFAGTSAWLNFSSVKKHLDLKIDPYKTVFAPVIASLIMGGFSLIFFKLFTLKLSSDMSVLLVMPIALVVYGFSLLKLKIFDEEELASIPFGNKLKRFL
jgi:stage V sporulation protein B